MTSTYIRALSAAVPDARSTTGKLIMVQIIMAKQGLEVETINECRRFGKQLMYTL